jgi:hypothetical protein
MLKVITSGKGKKKLPLPLIRKVILKKKTK